MSLLVPMVTVLLLGQLPARAQAGVLVRSYGYTLSIDVGGGTLALVQDGDFTIRQDTAIDTVRLGALTAFSTRSGTATFGLADVDAFEATAWGATGLVPGSLSLGFRDGGCYTTLSTTLSSQTCDRDTHPFGLTRNLILTLDDTTGQVPTFITRTYDFAFSVDIGGTQVTTQSGRITLRQDIFEPRVDLDNVLDFRMTSGSVSFGLADLGLFRGADWGDDGLTLGEFSLGLIDPSNQRGLCLSNLVLQPPQFACDPIVYGRVQPGLSLQLTDVGGGGGGGGGTVPEPGSGLLAGLAGLLLLGTGPARRRGSGRPATGASAFDRYPVPRGRGAVAVRGAVGSGHLQ